jgi:hypothetical protein
MKNSNSGNRTRDLSVCSALPQPTTPPRPHKLYTAYIILSSTRYSIGGIAATLQAEKSGVRISVRATDLSPDRFWDPPSLLFHAQAYRGPLPGLKRRGIEVDHSPLSSTEVKNEWSYKWPPAIRLYVNSPLRL